MELWQPLRNILIILMTAYGVGGALYYILRLTISDKWWWMGFLHTGFPYMLLPLFIFIPALWFLNAREPAVWLGAILLIGIAWLSPRYLPRASVDIEGTPLRVMTLNVYPYNEKIETVVAYILEQDIDVVALQEAYRIALYLDELRAQFPYTAGNPADDGNLVLAKYPLENSQVLWLASDMMQNQTIFPLNEVKHQMVDIRISDETTITLYNVHLIMPVTRTEPRFNVPIIPEVIFRYDETWRNTQINDLITLAKNNANPVIIMGDFNTADTSPAYDRLNANLTDAYRQTNSNFGATWPAGEFEDLSFPLPVLIRLDYIWHSDHFTPITSQVGQAVGSDHLPVLATLDLR